MSGSGRERQIIVDADISRLSSGHHAGASTHDSDNDGLIEIWAALIEKAFALFLGSSNLGAMHAEMSQEPVSGGMQTLDVGYPSIALAALTGRSSRTADVAHSQDDTMWQLVSQATEGEPVTVGTKPDATTLTPGHAYTVLGVVGPAADGYVRLKDPRGPLRQVGYSTFKSDVVQVSFTTGGTTGVVSPPSNPSPADGRVVGFETPLGWTNDQAAGGLLGIGFGAAVKEPPSSARRTETWENHSNDGRCAVLRPPMMARMEVSMSIASFIVRRVLSCSVLVLGLAATAGAASAGQRVCTELHVPVTLPGIPGATVYGELCRPKHDQWPSRVQFLVHGSTHNHYMWDFPFHPNQFSHVTLALQAGYATFNIDRLGTGLSTQPASHLVTLDVLIESLHQVAARLRDGTLCGAACDAPPFDKMIYFGSSLSTAYGWQLGSSYPGLFDGFVLAGLAHFTTGYWIELVGQHHVFPANQDPVFAGEALDDGYITTEPGWRSVFFINEDATHRRVPLIDETLKGELPIDLMYESAFAYVVGPPLVEPGPLPGPGGSPSYDIDVPVFLLMAEYDGAACGPTGPLPVCTAQSLRDYEQPFYSQPLHVAIVPEAKHSIHIHDSYREVHDGWLVPGLAAAGL